MLRAKFVEGVYLIAQFGLSFLFFGLALNPRADQILIGGDVVWLFLPLARFSFSAMQTGSVPLWNPQLFLGFPQYAEPQLSTFYPPMWLAAQLPIGTAFSLMYAFHFGLTGVGGYCLARQLKVSRNGAFVTGFVMTYSAFMLSHLHAGHFPHLMTIAYAPWLVFMANWAMERGYLSSAIIASLPLGLAMLVGYAPFFPFLVLLVTVVMLTKAIQTWLDNQRKASIRILIQWVLLGLMGSLLAAIQLLPTIEYANLSSRVATADYQFASSLSLPFWGLLTLIMPDIFGAPFSNAIYWAEAPVNAYWEFALYVGILPLLLYVMAWRFSNSAIRFWLWIGVGSIAIALGAEFAVHRILYQLVPGFGLFRVPARFGWFFTFATAIISGMMLDSWITNNQSEQLTPLLKHAKVLLPTVVIVLFGGVLIQAAVDDPIVRSQVSGIVSQIVRFIIIGTLALLLLSWQPSSSQRWYGVALLILIVDLWGFGNKFLVLETIEAPVGWIMTDIVLPAERATYRIATKGLPENSGVRFGFQHVNGYDDFRPESSYEMSKRVSSDARIARLLNVQYLLHGDEYGKVPIAPGWTEVGRPAGVTIYERFDMQPRAFIVYQIVPVTSSEAMLDFVDDPNRDFTQEATIFAKNGFDCEIDVSTDESEPSHVVITTYENEYISLTAQTDTTGLLVFSDLYYPGWVAKIDGNPAQIWRTDYALRGICVPPGTHEITMRFQPDIFRYGAYLTTLAVVIILFACLFQVRLLWRRQ